MKKKYSKCLRTVKTPGQTLLCRIFTNIGFKAEKANNKTRDTADTSV